MEFTVTIEKIIAGGRGLARHESGKVVMIDGVLPGEVVNVSEVKKHRGYIEAEPVEIISPSPERRQPVCPWYQDCGGCDLLHCNYDFQLQIKNNIVKEALKRAGVVCPGDCPVGTLPSPESLAYRYRLRMKVDRNGQVGFHKKRTNKIVPVSNCAIATSKINAAISILQSSSLLKEITGICNEIELLHSPADNALTLLLQVEEKNKADQDLLTLFDGCSAINQVGYKTGLQIHANPSLLPLKQCFVLSGDRQTSYSLSWAAGCFYQVNAGQNKQLVRLVCRLAGNVHGQSILDLYCGTGNFSIPLALRGATITGMELDRESIRWAKFNAETTGMQCRFIAADVHKTLLELVQTGQQVDIIILDPPRRGIGKAAGLLPKLQPRKIIYISCDPATLARDLATLCDRGYSLGQLIPVDMFPQTHHIESLALLEKN